MRSAGRHRTIAGIYYADLWDSWSMASFPLDRLLARLTDRLPPAPLPTDPTKTALTSPIVLLSGDVHHSFASRMVFRGSARFEDTQPKAVSAVIAQLVSSSLKNQSEKTLGLHDDGYTYSPAPDGWFVPPHLPEYYAGWNVKAGTSFNHIRLVSRSGSFGFDLPSDKPTVWLERPSLDPNAFGAYPPQHLKYQFNPAPDYHYLLEYLFTSTQGQQPEQPPNIPRPSQCVTPDDRKICLMRFNQATGYYRAHKRSASKTREIVGRNNLGEITFLWGGVKMVNHTLRWWSTDDWKTSDPVPLFNWSTYAVSLDPTYPTSLHAVEPTRSENITVT
jgi:hypothetical protein